MGFFTKTWGGYHDDDNLCTKMAAHKVVVNHHMRYFKSLFL